MRLREGEAFFVGNATVLLRLCGHTILTDPNFLHRGQRAYLGYGLWSRRRTEPALGVGELPPLDLVLLSHYHGDHFDRIAARGLDRHTPILTTPHAERKLRRLGFHGARSMRTWETQTFQKAGFPSLRVSSMPGRHGPGPLSALLPPVMGSLLETPDHRVYVSGDTIAYPALAEIPRRKGAIDTAFLHLGGTSLLGVYVTMDAEQGVAAAKALDPREVVPVHYDDYGLFKSTLDEFLAAARLAGLSARLRPVRRGETISLSPSAFPTIGR